MYNQNRESLQTKPGQASWIKGAIILSIGWFLLYATRTALSSALKDIGDFWGISESFLGMIASSFFFSYALLQIPSGILADRFGARKMIAVGFALQAAGLLLSVLSANPYQFLLARVLTGAGQATYFACQQAIIFFMLPSNRRAGGVAMTTAGAGLGSAVGFLLGKFLSTFALGWKMPFMVLTFLAGAFALLVTVTLPEPALERKRFEEQRPSAPVSSPKKDQAPPRWSFLIFMAISHFLTMYGFNLMLTWLPYYLETARSFEGRLSAAIPVIMPLIMAPATLIWGALADKQKSKDFVLWICLPVAGLAVAAVPAMITPVLVALVLALYGVTGKLVIDTILVTLVSENAPVKTRSTFLAIFNFAAAVAMVIAPWATGFIAEQTGSFDASFLAAGAFHFIALVFFALAMKGVAKARVSVLEE